MRRRMPDDFEACRVLVGHYAQRGIVIDLSGGIDQLTVDAAGERGLREPGTNTRGDFGDGNGMVEQPLATVGKCDYRHTSILSKVIRDPSPTTPWEDWRRDRNIGHKPMIQLIKSGAR